MATDTKLGPITNGTKAADPKATDPKAPAPKPHTNTHTHKASYDCICGSHGRERQVTHNHVGGSDPHHHSNVEDLDIGKDVRMLIKGATPEPGK